MFVVYTLIKILTWVGPCSVKSEKIPHTWSDPCSAKSCRKRSTFCNVQRNSTFCHVDGELYLPSLKTRCRGPRPYLVPAEPRRSPIPWNRDVPAFNKFATILPPFATPYETILRLLYSKQISEHTWTVIKDEDFMKVKCIQMVAESTLHILALMLFQFSLSTQIGPWWK